MSVMSIVLIGLAVMIFFLYGAYWLGQLFIEKKSWREYEKHAESYLKSRGYKTRLGRGTQDEGIDIVAWKDGQKYGVQVKHYTKSTVGGPTIRELVGSCALINAEPILITSGKLTKQAKRHAKELLVEVIYLSI